MALWSIRTDERGRRWARTVHPYDLAEYHFAWSMDGERWEIYRDQLHVTTAWADPSGDGIIAVLRTLDREARIGSRIDHT